METNIDNLINEFLIEKDATPETKRNYKYTLTKFFTWLIVKGISFDEIRTPHIINFKNECLEKGLSNTTVNTYLSQLFGFFKYLEDSGYKIKIRFSNIKRPERYKGFRKKPLEYAEYMELIGSIDLHTKFNLMNFRDALIIKLMLTYGLRNIEISRLQIKDILVDQEPNKILILGKGCKEKVSFNLDRELLIPIQSLLEFEYNIDLYKSRPNDKRPVFTSYKNPFWGEPMTTNRISKMIKSRMKKAGIGLIDKNISAHSLRHTTAMILIDQGKSLFEIQAYLRHTDANMTRNYLRYVEEKQRTNFILDIYKQSDKN